MSLLQGNHYKVYLISSLYEKLLDLFELIFFGKMSDTKKNKWGTLYKKLSEKSNFDFIVAFWPKSHKSLQLRIIAQGALN